MAVFQSLTATLVSSCVRERKVLLIEGVGGEDASGHGISFYMKISI